MVKIPKIILKCLMVILLKLYQTYERKTSHLWKETRKRHDMKKDQIIVIAQDIKYKKILQDLKNPIKIG